MSEESEQYRPQSEPTQEWPVVYLGLFGRRLDDEEVGGIESEVNNVFRGSLKKWEIAKAVRHLAMTAGSNPRKYPPTGEDIIRQIKANRYEFAKDRDHAPDMLRDHACQMGYGLERVDEWTAMLRRTSDPDERWNIICRPVHVENCQQREKYCRDNGLEYERYNPSAYTFADGKLVAKLADRMAVHV